jgi:hypothetical protein
VLEKRERKRIQGRVLCAGEESIQSPSDRDPPRIKALRLFLSADDAGPAPASNSNYLFLISKPALEKVRGGNGSLGSGKRKWSISHPPQ